MPVAQEYSIMKSGILDRNRHRSHSHSHWRHIGRSLASRIRHRPFTSGCLIIVIAFLLITGFRNYPTANRVARKKAQFELVQRTKNYNAYSTNVGVVIPKIRSDDVRWLWKYLKQHNDTTAFIYSTDKRPELDLHLAHSRRGREVSAYLSYVIDYYDNLPPYSIFIHADEKQRHNDLFGPKTSTILQNLRPEAMEAKGYLNLRCMHSPGCPSHVSPNNPTKSDIKAGDARAHFAQIYRELFGMNVVVPDLIGAPCCAQFAVSRKQIRRRPKTDYVHMLDWVDGASARLIDSYAVGWVFESLWHVVFGMEAIECPAYEQCRCDNYGWCGPLASGKVLTPIRPEGMNQTDIGL